LNKQSAKSPEDAYVIAHADKTVLKISGLTVKGLNDRQLEELLTTQLNSVVRVIGVTASSVDMDIYGIEEDSIQKDADGIIRAVSLAEGITVSELSQIVYAKKVVPVSFDDIPNHLAASCARERWMRNA